MTEGGATRTKRVGAKLFKNPPQPHMCIQDFLRGSEHPCYINVLSWDKIGMATCPYERLPLYGGMKISPPRTENPDVTVFFVMANPETLRRNGKNALDFKEQSKLIELFLDFVEAMNEGVVFARQYKILNDRDITGELKEVWMVVQNDRAKVQNGSATDEQQQQQQQPQHQQQQKPQKSQSHQQYRQPKQNEEQQPSPPQYHVNSSQNHEQIDKSCYDFAYIRQSQNTINPQNDRIFYSRPAMGGYEQRDNFYHRDMTSNTTNNSQSQQNFSMSQYQYQQIPPQMTPYNNPNVNPNTNAGCPTLSHSGLPAANNNSAINQRRYDHYSPMHENNVYVKFQRMLQPQQPQVQLVHAPPVSLYETPVYDHQFQGPMAMMRIFTPPNNLPNKPNNVTSGRTAAYQICAERPDYILQDNVKKNIQVTDLDEDEPRKGLNDGEQMAKFNDTIKEDNQGSVVNERRKIMVLKRNKTTAAHYKVVKNGTAEHIEQQQSSLDSQPTDDESSNLIAQSKNGYNVEQLPLSVDDGGAKVVKSFANTLKNVHTANPGTSDQKVMNKQIAPMNGQSKSVVDKDSQETFQMYTILRKPETINAQGELTNEIAQMSIKECTDSSGEIAAVPS